MPGTKTIATLGPATSSYTVQRKIVTGGLDVVRLNFSRGRRERPDQKLWEICLKFYQRNSHGA